MKVQPELMRHSDIRTTMNIYGKAMDESKRTAHGRVVRLVLPAKTGLAPLGLLRKLGESGLVFAHASDRVPPEVFGEAHLEETDVFAGEGKAGLLAAEDSKTTHLPTPED